MSDGRSCYTVLGGAVAHGSDMCDNAQDQMARPAVPTSKMQAKYFRRLLM